ncbi:MAG: symmetrical bis(5'-nucleosyl)-tetraphosphatase [Gammaproteobacteria bacterium]
MAIYAIGDVQGCCDELKILVDELNFDPAVDRLWFVGDLVNRGPQSLESLRFIKALGDSAVCVLGNHDLHLLAQAINPNAPVKEADLQQVLEAHDRDELINWLRRQPLAHFDARLNTLMVHAGVHKDWNTEQTLQLAAEVERQLSGDGAESFLAAMYGSKPEQWFDELEGMERLRFITNCLTRIRYCGTDGTLEFKEKFQPGTQPDHLVPWFELPNRTLAESRIVFGHWSTLGLVQKKHLLALDTGCVWGGTLTAVCLDEDRPPVQITSRQPSSF